MKKIYLLIVLLALQLNSQNLEVRYSYLLIDEADDYGLVLAYNLKLLSTGEKTLLEFTTKDTAFVTPVNGLLEFGVNTNMNSKFKHFKDLKNKLYYFKAPYQQEIVIDDDYTIKWQIMDEHKTIHNYYSQKAVGSFRGRKYEVYFTPEIPIHDGPLKFDGLPGLVLSVKSSDGMVNIKAETIRFLDLHSLENPYQNQKTITWTAFSKQYKKKFEKLINYSNNSEETDMIIPNRTYEYFFEVK